MLQYKILSTMSGETLRQAFVEAFSDYQVKIDLPYWKFRQMLRRRGYYPSLSMGAFDDGQLIGFVLTGFRTWGGRATAYDLGTGVLPEYRRQGITTELFGRVKSLLLEKQAEQYLLEVLKPNSSAIRLYEKQGFEVRREFSCFRADRDVLIRRHRSMHLKAERAGRLDLRQLQGYWDFEPSWQNSIASVEAVPKAFESFVVRFDDTIAGYGILEKKTGDIPQIAVSKDFRGNGIAGIILAEIARASESETLSILNVAALQEPTEKFLADAGFSPFVGQYEMVLKF